MRYSLDVYDARGNWVEQLGQLQDLDPARAAFVALCTKYPAKIIFLRQGAQTLGRSDEPPQWMATYRPAALVDPGARPPTPPEKRPQDPHLDGRDLKFETLEHGGAEPDTMPNAIRVTDPQGRTADYVLLSIDGKVVVTERQPP
jgi:hypothetical protein